MSGYFTKIDPTRVCSVNRFGSFPPSEKASLIEHEYSSQEWAPLYLRRFRLEPENYRTAASIANVGALRASRITGNGATAAFARAVPRRKRFARGYRADRKKIRFSFLRFAFRSDRRESNG
jgi:hypothetical protein